MDDTHVGNQIANLQILNQFLLSLFLLIPMVLFSLVVGGLRRRLLVVDVQSRLRASGDHGGRRQDRKLACRDAATVGACATRLANHRETRGRVEVRQRGRRVDGCKVSGGPA